MTDIHAVLGALLNYARDEDNQTSDKNDEIILLAESEVAYLAVAELEVLVREEQPEGAHSLREAGRNVEYVADENDQEGAEHLEKHERDVGILDVQLVLRTDEQRLEKNADHDDHTVPRTECNILPARAVPYTYNEEYDQRGYAGGKYLRDMSACGGLAEARTLHLLARGDERVRHSHGIEEIVLEPCAK